jgi:hypothetical protein
LVARAGSASKKVTDAGSPRLNSNPPASMPASMLRNTNMTAHCDLAKRAVLVKAKHLRSSSKQTSYLTDHIWAGPVRLMACLVSLMVILFSH